MSKEKAQHIEFNAAAMNITNRIAPDCKCSGPMELSSGLRLDGTIEGDLIVRGGVLWVSKGALLRRGRVQVEGDMYLFGQVGEEGEDPSSTIVVCTGELVLAETSVFLGTMHCARPNFMKGSRMSGQMKTFSD